MGEPGTEHHTGSPQPEACGARQPRDATYQPNEGRDGVQMEAGVDDARGQERGRCYHPPETGDDTHDCPPPRGEIVGQVQDVPCGLLTGEQLPPDPALD